MMANIAKFRKQCREDYSKMSNEELYNEWIDVNSFTPSSNKEAQKNEIRAQTIAERVGKRVLDGSWNGHVIADS